MKENKKLVELIIGLIINIFLIIVIFQAGFIGESICLFLIDTLGLYSYVLNFSLIALITFYLIKKENYFNDKTIISLIFFILWLFLFFALIDNFINLKIMSGSFGNLLYTFDKKIIGNTGIIAFLSISLYLVIYFNFQNKPFIVLFYSLKDVFFSEKYEEEYEEEYEEDPSVDVNKVNLNKNNIKSSKGLLKNKSKKIFNFDLFSFSLSSEEDKNDEYFQELKDFDSEKDSNSGKRIFTDIYGPVEEVQKENKKLELPNDYLETIQNEGEDIYSHFGSKIMPQTDVPDNEGVKSLGINKINGKEYTVPQSTLLEVKKSQAAKRNSLEKESSKVANNLVESLKMYGLNVTLDKVTIGPNITRFELVPEAGVKVNKFLNLSNDLALVLAAKSIRIEAPIPGKSLIGIEVPNKEIMTVQMSELWSDKKNKKRSFLQVVLGKNIDGEAVFLDIDKTPHLLVAGSTGSGKSVCINTIIISMLLKASPEELKLVMIDPKKVELYQYNNIPHLLTPVVTDPKKASVVLQKIVAEMEARYEIFANNQTRNIESYNQKVTKDKSLPFIVVIIDELSDLMLVAANDVETSIARIAQMARAAGIHLIIATQRPSTDVITGLIKANIPSRISFSVSSNIDSRTILDSGGAEKLLGKGDMLYSLAGSNILKRVQGVYLEDSEIERIVEDIKKQKVDVEQLIKEQETFNADLTEIFEKVEMDPYYEDAREIVISEQRASTSLIQRRLKVGFNRASRIMEQLEDEQIISAADGTKPRKVLVNEEYL